MAPNRLLTAALACLATMSASGSEVESLTVTVTYLANEGVMISDGASVVLIDPLFENDFGTYQSLSDAQQQAIVNGEGRYDGIDLVLISHEHGDHFDAPLLTELLLNDAGVTLGAASSVLDLVRADERFDERLEAQLLAIDPEPNAGVVENDFGDFSIRTSWQRHGNRRHYDLVNLVHQVDMAGQRIVHLGDADAKPENFDNLRDYAGSFELALAPVWFFGNDPGHAAIEVLSARHTVAFHVPDGITRERFEQLRDDRPWSIFVEHGEYRLVE